MTTNLHFPITLKLILSSLASLVVITLFFIIRTDFSPFSFQPAPAKTIQISSSSTRTKEQSADSVSCGKILPSLADALIHYAASNVTPQQTLSEISVTKKVTKKTNKTTCKTKTKKKDKKQKIKKNKKNKRKLINLRCIRS